MAYQVLQKGMKVNMTILELGTALLQPLLDLEWQLEEGDGIANEWLLNANEHGTLGFSANERLLNANDRDDPGWRAEGEGHQRGHGRS